jgi:hypothetical protein
MVAHRFGHGSIFASVCNTLTGTNSTAPPQISTAWGENASGNNTFLCVYLDDVLIVDRSRLGEG